MIFSMSRWRAGHLFLSWVAYWVALAAITLGPGILQGWLVSRGPEDSADISLGFINGVFNATITQYGQQRWAMSASITTLALWFAVPPLLLWGAWLVRASESRARSGQATRELAGTANPAGEMRAPQGDSVSRTPRE